jgi:monofunctional biosynthetic peptidoglycan transglycosylase
MIASYLLMCVFALSVLRWTNPGFTAVQAQRRVESWFAQGKYEKRYAPVEMAKISPHLAHAAVAAEDTNFYAHEGIDWEEMEKLIERDLEKGKIGRGGSTITQQLVKNLFATTHRSWLRKGIEFALAPVAERLLPKERILELYLNVIEWGPGVYGAEAAARFHYGVPASRLTREQAARLAACIPAPRRRRPAQMTRYAGIIQQRMTYLGW